MRVILIIMIRHNLHEFETPKRRRGRVWSHRAHAHLSEYNKTIFSARTTNDIFSKVYSENRRLSSLPKRNILAVAVFAQRAVSQTFILFVDPDDNKTICCIGLYKNPTLKKPLPEKWNCSFYMRFKNEQFNCYANSYGRGIDHAQPLDFEPHKIAAIQEISLTSGKQVIKVTLVDRNKMTFAFYLGWPEGKIIGWDTKSKIVTRKNFVTP